MSLKILSWLKKSQTPTTSQGEITMLFTLLININLMRRQVDPRHRREVTQPDRANAQLLCKATATDKRVVTLYRLARCITPSPWQITRLTNWILNDLQLFRIRKIRFQPLTLRSLTPERRQPHTFNRRFGPLNLRFQPQLVPTS